MIGLVFKSHAEAYYAMLQRVRIEGRETSPRGIDTRELAFAQFAVDDPLTFPLVLPGREFRDVIGLVEGLSMVGQVSLPEALTSRVKKFGEFTDDGILWGAYGARLHGQIGDLVARLAEDRDSRQAVLTIFDGGRDLAAAKRDVPCTIALQFLVRDDRLSMRVTMRSNDMWLGLPYDMVQFSILQATIAQVLGVEVGQYVHSVGSLHLYEHDIRNATSIERHQVQPDPMPFPLWGEPSFLADIGARARLLLAYPYEATAETLFEAWARDLL